MIDVDTYKPISYGKILNAELEQFMLTNEFDHVVLEMVASYGMAVGKSVFDTVFHIGRFSLVRPEIPYTQVYRGEVKMHLVGKMSAKDGDVRDSMVYRLLSEEEIERWGDYGKGVKDDKGFFYGFNNDIYQAYAVGITWLDKTEKGTIKYEKN